METYTIAATPQDLARGMGTEVIASSLQEALAKYEAMRGGATPAGEVFVRLPDGTFTEAWTFVSDDYDDSLPPMAFTD